ncbi:TIGR01777 family oxidoreductase [Bacillus alkalisoli]|uniref:TIGR01777 family oxidoreductase n=1 Tax=Bacillus alkalisoli TaxID=2011008 RepID=UPI000C23FB8E|nr:TIGR01777 family oxidoreductase [Bacillus alkalisoli]
MNTKPKIVIAGGTGFIGKFLEEKYKKLNYDVFIISRQPRHIQWNEHERVIAALNEAEMLINLAGKSVNCRYNEKNKKAIMNSRTGTTEVLGQLIAKCTHAPKLWINSSTATIYRHADDRPMTEKSGEIGTGFSVEVAKAWEKTFFDSSVPHTRQVALRIAIVLGSGGGVMTPYKNLVKSRLGGHQGKGYQQFSWIHIEDLYRIIEFIKEREDLNGVFNCSAPNPVNNKEQMKIMRNAYGVGYGLPAMKWMLEIGSVFLRTETELVLKSRWVIPERLQEEGFSFKYPTLEEAMSEIVKSS